MLEKIKKFRVISDECTGQLKVLADGKEIQDEDLKEAGKKAIEALLEFLYTSQEVEKISLEIYCNDVISEVRLKTKIEGIPE